MMPFYVYEESTKQNYLILNFEGDEDEVGYYLAANLKTKQIVLISSQRLRNDFTFLMEEGIRK